MNNMQFIGVGEDGEKISILKNNNSSFLIFAENNSQSPFEFSSEKDARNFADMLSSIRMRHRLKILGDENR